MSEIVPPAFVDEKVRRERGWTSAGATPARELVRSTAAALSDQRTKLEIVWWFAMMTLEGRRTGTAEQQKEVQRDE
jgi:hypothetical protein